MQMEAVHSETSVPFATDTFQSYGSDITSQECFDMLMYSQEKVQSTDSEA
jgi:hypothetical protein